MLSFLGLKLRCAQSCRNLCNPMDCSPPLSMEFSRQEYWSGLPFPSPGDFPNPGIEHLSPALAGGFFTSKPPGKPDFLHIARSSQVASIY